MIIMIIILIVRIIMIAMIIRIIVIIVNYLNQAMLPKHTITIFPHFLMIFLHLTST